MSGGSDSGFEAMQMVSMNCRSARTTALVMLLVVVSFPAGGLRADTVYLKNGAYIDGEIVSRSDRGIVVTIGRVGRIEIAHDDIVSIEKNKRNGTRAVNSRSSTKAHSGAPSKDEKRKTQSRGKKNSKESAADSDASPSGKAKSATAKSRAPRDDTEAPTGTKAGSRSVEDGEKSEISAELRKELVQLVHDLQRQRSRVRHRAERRLLAIGAPAVEFVLPLAENESQFTRMSAFKILASTTPEGDDTPIIEAALKGLDDDYVYAREYAANTLRKLAKEEFQYSARGAAAARQAAVSKWNVWWAEEKGRRIEAATKNEVEDDAKNVSQTES